MGDDTQHPHSIGGVIGTGVLNRHGQPTPSLTHIDRSVFGYSDGLEKWRSCWYVCEPISLEQVLTLVTARPFAGFRGNGNYLLQYYGAYLVREDTEDRVTEAPQGIDWRTRGS